MRKQQCAKAGLKSRPPKVTLPLDPASHSPARAPYHGKSIPANKCGNSSGGGVRCSKQMTHPRLTERIQVTPRVYKP